MLLAKVFVGAVLEHKPMTGAVPWGIVGVGS